MKKVILTGLGILSLTAVAYANHSWNDYHWARTTSSFDLIVVNSTTSDWDPYVTQAISDWSASGVLNLIEDPNGSTNKKTRRQCNGGNGKVRICNLAYGQTGWLGIAGISLDANGHITTGYTKMNDTYFSQSYYNQPNWKQSVTCQELGHNVGLGHQDEDFNNQSLFSCMDYQDPPYEFPNAHDYEQLDTMYGHLDSYDSYEGSGGGGGDDGGGNGCNAPPGKGCNKGKTNGNNGNIGWGVSIGRRNNVETFMRIDPDGTRHITFVTWVPGHEGDHSH
ncbi:MAG: hypothetical protein HKN70_00735 [Gammaproteobacteria bacterium]|nr:hypothetical protein [Gammaproteobacteria bacterium]